MVLIHVDAHLDHVFPAFVVTLVAEIIEQLGEREAELCGPAVLGQEGLSLCAGIGQILKINVRTNGIDVDTITLTQYALVIRLAHRNANVLAVTQVTHRVENGLGVGHIGLGIVLDGPLDQITEVHAELERVTATIASVIVLQNGIYARGDGYDVIVHNVERDVEEVLVDREARAHFPILGDLADPGYHVGVVNGDGVDTRGIPVLKGAILEIESQVAVPDDLDRVRNRSKSILAAGAILAGLALYSKSSSHAQGKQHAGRQNDSRNFVFHVHGNILSRARSV